MVLSDAEFNEYAIDVGKKTSKVEGVESVLSFPSSSACDCNILESSSHPFKALASCKLSS